MATLTLPRQEAYSAARQRNFNGVVSLPPAHALAVHRSLGSVARARLEVYQVYQALFAYRHEANVVEPASPEAIPA